MSALVLDAGALIAVERNDQLMRARLRTARRTGMLVRTSAVVVAQVWRGEGGRQALLAQLLRVIEIEPVDGVAARQAGELQALARTRDPIDALLVLLAKSGDRIVTSDPDDIGQLVSATGRDTEIIRC